MNDVPSRTYVTGESSVPDLNLSGSGVSESVPEYTRTRSPSKRSGVKNGTPRLLERDSTMGDTPKVGICPSVPVRY